MANEIGDLWANVNNIHGPLDEGEITRDDARERIEAAIKQYQGTTRDDFETPDRYWTVRAAVHLLPAPGTAPDLGPCSSPCLHHDCEAIRRMAADTCPYCKKPIGYDRRFYELPGGSVLAHAACHEDAQETEG